MNSYELHNETPCYFIQKFLWAKSVWHLCDSMSFDDENYFLLECLAYRHIKFELHSICYNTNFYNLL